MCMHKNCFACACEMMFALALFVTGFKKGWQEMQKQETLGMC
jgi:hypothetical protein